jgi:uroporphyrinogen decarboxylase
LLSALAGATISPPPVWLMRQAGRYLPEYRETRKSAGSFLDLCYTPRLATEVTLQPIRRFQLDAAILFSDILVVPDALGQPVSFQEGIGPVLAPIGAQDIDRLSAGRVLQHLAPVYDTVARVAASLPDAVALIGFAGAPWTVAAYMIEGQGSRDFAKAKRWAVSDPQGFGRLMAILVEATAAHLSAQIAAGAEAVQIFDSWAGVLSEQGFDRWSIAPTAEIVRRLHADHPGVPIIGFPRGCGLRAAEYVDKTGVDAVSIDFTVPARWARETLQTRCAVQGNLDPVVLLAGGGPMEQEVARLVETLGDGPYVFNLGHGVLPETPPENVARLVERVRAGKRG